MKKLLVGLLVLTFVLGPVSGFWSRSVLANTEEERKVYHCVAEPWNDEEWNKAIPPPGSDQNPTNSPANSVRPGEKPEPQKAQQKPQKSPWSQFRLFLFDLKALFGGR